MTKTIKQAIETHTIPMTERRDVRVIAIAYGGRATVTYDYNISHEDNHKAAAGALIEKLSWGSVESYAPGVLRNGNFVWVEK